MELVVKLTRDDGTDWFVGFKYDEGVSRADFIKYGSLLILSHARKLEIEGVFSQPLASNDGQEEHKPSSTS